MTVQTAPGLSLSSAEVERLQADLARLEAKGGALDQLMKLRDK